ncbi:hypothetical protein Cabys_747 [Caldithrix abyssi DSM 13497]|uniref:Uncharacterized protein n=1 Tax=Caldithrix abyssi DSM 13497 TaxID=880073 RepID=A0A1J1C663_CALAY|nr:hypothetical protein Cabys_747 [Caldithrix abyssi DSM 13497]
MLFSYRLNRSVCRKIKRFEKSNNSRKIDQVFYKTSARKDFTFLSHFHV